MNKPKKIVVFSVIVVVLIAIACSLAQAGPIDWMTSKMGYVPAETIRVEKEAIEKAAEQAKAEAIAKATADANARVEAEKSALAELAKARESQIELAKAQTELARMELIGVKNQLVTVQNGYQDIKNHADRAESVSAISILVVGLMLMLVITMSWALIRSWAKSVATWRREKSIEKGKKQGNLREFPKQDDMPAEVGVAI
jgi:hypothetical protein